MDKYGDFYGCEKISGLLGLDQAALDFSSESKEKMRLKRDTAWSALWVEKKKSVSFWILKGIHGKLQQSSLSFILPCVQLQTKTL